MTNDTNNTAGSDCPAATCSQYIPFMEIPPEVHAAAETLFLFFEKEGMREWQFSHVADRRLVVNLERQVEDLRAQVSSANSQANTDMKKDSNAGSGCPYTTCSPSSLTPETDAMVASDQHHIENDNWITMSCYWRMSDLARTLERERDEWRKKAVDLHARHKGALEDFETAITERDMARATANTFRQCAEVTFGPMPFPRKFHWENA